MRRFCHCAVLVVVAGAPAALVAGMMPAAAQFGGIFGDPPRPPGNVPNRPSAPPRPPPDDRFAPQPQYEPPQPQSLPSPDAGVGPVAAPGGIQSQSLPPPPGVPAEPASLPAPPLPQPGQSVQPKTTPGAAPQQAVAPANAGPQPGEEVVIAPPAEKIVNPTAVFSGLDKITGRITSFDVAINETVQFGALQVTPRVCYTRPPTQTQNTDAFVDVDEVTLQGEVKRIFTGWMFASSPGLHAVEHPIYDVWLTDCKGRSPPPTPVAQAQPTPAGPRPAAPPRRAPPPPARWPGPPR
jgi:hypothetical protein